MNWQAPPPPPPAPLPLPATRRPRRGRTAAAVTGAVALSVASATGGAVVATRLDDEPVTVVRTVTAGAEGALEQADFDPSGETLDVANVLDAMEGSVVSIRTVMQVQQGPYVSEGEGAGTGFVVDDRGLILTNAHVVDGATEVSVTLDHDDETRPAIVVAADPGNDVAVLQVSDTEGLVPASFGSQDGVQIGDEVVAIGNALALEGGLSVTKGIVSGLDRSIETAEGPLSGLLQTDAAISSGNSGGPLVNAAGQVIGINTAVATSSGSINAANVGFVIPIEQALDVASGLLSSPAAA